MKSIRIGEIAKKLYESESDIGDLAIKNNAGMDIGNDIEEIAKQLSVTPQELKDFLRMTLEDFRDLK